MKPAPPSKAAMFGSRRATTGAEVIEGSNPKPSKFITNAEQQWYAMMASKSHADETWAAQEKKPNNAPKIISSPHTAVQFRTPGAPASAVPRGVATLRPPGASMMKPPPSTAPSSVLRVARQGREVNSKIEAKPVPGQSYPVGFANRPGAKPPPPMHPSMMMRKVNGKPLTNIGGRKPPPPSMRKHIPTPGHVPRPRGPPPPEVLARLRAQGPPGHSPAHPKHPAHKVHQNRKKQGPPPNSKQPDFAHTNHATTMKVPSSSTSHEKSNMKKPNSLAQSGQNVIASKPVPVVSAAEEPSPLKDTVDIPDALDQTLMTESESEKEWIQLWDEEVESNYYYNQITGEASWIRPEEVTDDITSAGGGGGGSDSVTSSAGGSMYPDESWERYWDEDAAAHYLHNTLTGETRWESDYQGTTDLDFALDFEADTKTDH